MRARLKEPTPAQVASASAMLCGGTVYAMARTLRLYRDAAKWNGSDKVAAADILAAAGFTAADVIEYVDEAIEGHHDRP